MVSTSVLVRLHMCEHLKKGGKSRPLRAQQTVLGPSGAPPLRQQPFLGTEGTTPHTTPPGRLMDWAPPGDAAPWAWAGLASTLSFPFFPPQALMTVDVVGSFLPCRRENVAVWALLPTPVETAQTHTKTLMLFTSRPDYWPFIHFASWNIFLCSLLLSLLGQSKYKSKSLTCLWFLLCLCVYAWE